jgi:hypothetical protein
MEEGRSEYERMNGECVGSVIQCGEAYVYDVCA